MGAMAAGVGLNVLLNVWAIPRYGPMGAAWTTVATQTFVGLWLSIEAYCAIVRCRAQDAMHERSLKNSRRASMSDRLRIAMLAACPFPWPRGTPIRIHRMTEALARHGHEVHVVTYHLGKELSASPYEVHRIRDVPCLSVHRRRPDIAQTRTARPDARSVCCVACTAS